MELVFYYLKKCIIIYNKTYNIYGHERGVIIKKFIKTLIIALVMFTIFFTSTNITLSASGWGFSKNNDHEVPEIGKYKDIIDGTDSFYVGPNEKSVYLTFDAGYDNGVLEKILDTLKDKNVKASFFVTGDFVKRFPNLVLRLVNDGHLVCNHSYSHKRINTLSKEVLKNDLKKLEDEYYNLTGLQMVNYFRPPEGEFDRNSLLNVQSLGYKTIFWSIAYKDWDTNNQSDVDYCVKTIMNNLHNGAIILMHSVSSSNQKALSTVIEQITKEGYTFKTVDSL